MAVRKRTGIHEIGQPMGEPDSVNFGISLLVAELKDFEAGLILAGKLR
jgi:hypothetical protein